MPVSRHKRKQVLSKRPKRKKPVLPEAPQWKTIRLRGHRFAQLKKSADFVNWVKIARLINAIAFGLKCLDDYLDDMSPIGRRQTNRAIFVTAGYLHEGLDLVGSMQLRYAVEPFYEGFKDLLDSQTFELQRKMLKEIRHSVGFHLDSRRDNTEKTIQNLALRHWDLVSAADNTPMGLYFNFADVVDFNYLVDKFNHGGSDEETFTFIIRSFADIFAAFQGAGETFLQGMGEKLEIWKFTDSLDTL
jgi:hypothetical protein